MDRVVGTLLLAVIVLLWVTGVVMLYGTWLPWLFDLHRIAGFSLIALIPFKITTISQSWLRGTGWTLDRKVGLLLSVVLAGWILLIIVLGISWMWRLGPYSSLHQTLITWHWILGVLILPVFALHAWRGWPRPQKEDFLSRRSFLKLLGLVGGSTVFARWADYLAEAQSTEASPRRFTGSRGFGSFAGNDFPVTGESKVELDPGQWQLAVSGAVHSPLTLAYQDILAFQQLTVTEAIDCHNGWYSVQAWQGIPLANLLEKARLKENVTGVRMVSATGLSNTHPLGEARQILLATHVSGQVLDASHGFPLRAVIPGRRGWFWLKWLTRIEVLDDPIEVVGGILCTPLQVFRELNHPRASSDIP